MADYRGLKKPHKPDWESALKNIRRQGTPKRVHHLELFHDGEIRETIIRRFGLADGLNPKSPDFGRQKYIAFQRFIGMDHVSVNLVGMAFPMKRQVTEDTAALKRQAGRSFIDEHAGVITNWQEFEKYPWPDPNTPAATSELEWYQKNLPDDLCIFSHTGHFAEYLSWLMGYETLSYALYDQRDLVKALASRILQYHTAELKRVLQFSRVKAIWGSDDMGFKTGTLIAPNDMREFVLTGHKALARMAHDAGRLYLLYSCGNLSTIMDDLTDDVKIDGKHSFEDTIEDVRRVKHTYGRKIALLGGIDVDFLCRADESAIRQRVRDTLDTCLAGGGYCLGSGNSVANYVPVDNYLAMVDEGRLHHA